MWARRLILLWAMSCLMPLGFASPNSEITLERRAWSPIDGAPAGAWSVSQGADGLIWFASSGGVYRYDGEKFTKVSKIYGYALRSNNVVLVHPTSRGIAVLYQFGGMSVFTLSSVTKLGGTLTIEKYGDAGTMVRFVLASPTIFN